jgi:hypothetical protein
MYVLIVSIVSKKNGLGKNTDVGVLFFTTHAHKVRNNGSGTTHGLQRREYMYVCLSVDVK